MGKLLVGCPDMSKETLMSSVVFEPELVQGAVQNLAGIRGSLTEAAASVSGPTTGIAAAAQDEISVALASVFGNYGEQFQALSAQARAFHAQFESLLSASTAAYTSAEATNAAQVVSGQVQAGFGAVAASQPDLFTGINQFWSAVAAPYNQLGVNTQTNLQAIQSTYQSRPFPFLNQILSNQQGYAQTFGAGLAAQFQNLPATFANIPANIQIAIQGASTFNPGALLQGFIANQTGYAQTVSTALQAAGPELVTGLQQLPPAFQEAFQDLLVGNNIAAYQAINSGLVNAILPGFQDVFFDLSAPPSDLPIAPLGTLGALAPTLTIPGQMAQNFTNLLPPGSIPAQMAQNFTNVVNTLTNFNATVNSGTLAITFGAPLQIIFDSIGMPINTLGAINSSSVAFMTALQAGDASGAAAAILDAPAFAMNGFLNGQTVVGLPDLTTHLTFGGMDFGSLTTSAQLPVGGLLTPLGGVVLNPGGAVPGTPIGGFIPGIMGVGQELADAITPH
jgi:hypothetical protein